MITVLAWIAGLAAAALLIDQLALWAERHGWLYWRRRTPAVDGGAVTGMFGELQSLLSPSNRHVVEEQRSREMTALVARTEEKVAEPTDTRDPAPDCVDIPLAEPQTTVLDWDGPKTRVAEGDGSRESDSRTSGSADGADSRRDRSDPAQP